MIRARMEVARGILSSRSPRFASSSWTLWAASTKAAANRADMPQKPYNRLCRELTNKGSQMAKNPASHGTGLKNE